jgi:hypothetical protein
MLFRPNLDHAIFETEIIRDNHQHFTGSILPTQPSSPIEISRLRANMKVRGGSLSLFWPKIKREKARNTLGHSSRTFSQVGINTNRI